MADYHILSSDKYGNAFQVVFHIPVPDQTNLVGYAYRDAIVEWQGGDPDSWIDISAALPLKAQRKWYSKLPYGYARGWEPVLYVNNIRAYYNILVWLTEQEETEEPESAPPPEPEILEASPADAVAVGGVGGVTLPERLPRYYVKPAYPPAARRAKVRGTVHLEVIVQSDGTVGDVTVVDSSRPGSGFEEAAVAAVKRWRYTPALRNDRPVDASILVRVDFQ